MVEMLSVLIVDEGTQIGSYGGLLRGAPLAICLDNQLLTTVKVYSPISMKVVRE